MIRRHFLDFCPKLNILLKQLRNECLFSTHLSSLFSCLQRIFLLNTFSIIRHLIDFFINQKLLKSSQKTQSEYQKCLSTYKSVKNKYEDLWLRLPKKSDNSNDTKIEKKFIETKKKYNKLCQKLHILHNDYCLITNEAKQYENDFRILLIPNLISYHELILMDSGNFLNNSSVQLSNRPFLSIIR